LPAALLVIFWWQRGRLSWHRDVLPLLPFFVVGAVAGVFTAWVERKLIGAEGAAFDLTVIDRCLIAGRAIWFYLSKLVWPADLMFFYPRWHVSQAVWWQYLFPAAVLALATALWAVRRRWRAPLAGFLFFAGTLFPVLGFCNVYPFIVSFVADHFQYLASLGIIVLAGTALTLGLRRMGLANRSAGYVLSMMVLMCLAFLTWRQSRMYADVVVLYKTTIQRNPDCWMAYNNLGTQLLIDGDVETAIADFKKALELRPDFSEAHNNLGLVLANHQQYDEAIAHYREALKANRFSSAAYNNLGNALLATGKFEDGVASFKKALEIDPNYAEACNNLGAALTGHQQYEEAIPYFQRALEIQPDYAEAHNNFGLALADCQRFDEAIVHYKRILKIHPNNAEAHYNFGMALSALHQLDQAIEEYDKSLKIRPDYAEAHNNLGNVLAELGKIDEAIEHYRKALEGQPENTDFLNNLGNALTRRRQHDEALACFQRAVKIKPDSVAILNNLGLAFSECGRFDEAIVSFRKILEFQPNNADTYLNLGGIRIRQGQSDAAIVEFRKAWEIKRDDARISCCLAMALASSRQLREAVAQYQATLAIDPNYLQAVQNLAWLLAVCPDESIRNGAKAVEYAKRAIQLSDGKDPSVFDTLAAAYAENGQFADAAQAAQHATELAAANGNMQLAEAIQSRLQLYQLDLPYHVSFEDAP
jgi:tetratricopeptide (TPR) repeat protein